MPPGRGSAAGEFFFGSALLQPARSVCVSSERFFIESVPMPFVKKYQNSSVFVVETTVNININIIFYIAQIPTVRPRAHYMVIIVCQSWRLFIDSQCIGFVPNADCSAFYSWRLFSVSK